MLDVFRRFRFFLHRLVRFEYWSMHTFYAIPALYIVYLAIKARSLTFFAAVNPALRMGGAVGYDKYEAQKLIDEQYLPKTCFFVAKTPVQTILQQMELHGLQFPVIAKPNMGERGVGVEKLNTSADLTNYIANFNGNFMLQEFLQLPLEFGVFYYRMPDKSSKGVISVTQKQFMQLTGNGKLSILQLMQNSPRYILQIPRLKQKMGDGIHQILSQGQTYLLEPIGNHNRGTIFLDANYLLSEQLSAVFDNIVEPMNGFFYGRFDIKTTSPEDLLMGKNIKIMEVNGVASEPAHIYQPNNSLLNAYRDVFKHLNLIYKIAQQNHQQGFKYPSFAEFKEALKRGK